MEFKQKIKEKVIGNIKKNIVQFKNNKWVKKIFTSPEKSTRYKKHNEIIVWSFMTFLSLLSLRAFLNASPIDYFIVIVFTCCYIFFFGLVTYSIIVLKTSKDDSKLSRQEMADILKSWFYCFVFVAISIEYTFFDSNGLYTFVLFLSVVALGACYLIIKKVLQFFKWLKTKINKAKES